VAERWALGAVCVAAVLFRVALGVGDHGMYWPDEIYQSLEPAHELVHGEGLLPWEYVDGARTWVLPGLIAGLLALLSAAGLDDPATSVIATQLAFVAVAAATVLATYALARSAGASRAASVAGAAAFALAPLTIYFGHRALSETASALLVAAGLALVLAATPAARGDGPGWEAGRRWLWLGAALLALAVMLRLQNAIFCAGVLALLAARREWRPLRDAALVFAGGALAMGLLDLATWGRFLHSAQRYIRVNVIDGRASDFGVEPFGYYAEHLWTAMPELTLVLVPLAVLGARRAPELLALAVAYLLAHSLVEHKELRFVLPAVPLLCAAAAVGLDALGERARPVALGAVGALALGGALHAGDLTWGDLGSRNGEPGTRAWGHFADVNRLLLEAHDREDLCGLRLEQQDRVWSGGYTYLGREVPYYAGGEGAGAGHVNYVIEPAEPVPPGQEVVALDGTFQLVRIADGCRGDPAFRYDRL
jgi:GPI mannosyltransferase 3